MYNEDIKKGYVKYREERGETNLVKSFERVARKTEPFEEQAGFDVCLFSVEQIENMYKSWNVKSYNSLYNYNSLLKKYMDYCIDNHITDDYQNHFTEFKAAKIRKLLNKTITNNRLFTKKEVLEMSMDPILENPRDQFLILAQFEGIGGNDWRELSNLSIYDVNFDNGIIRTYKGREIKASLKLLEYTRATFETNVIISSKGRVFRLLPSDKILRNVRIDATEGEVASYVRIISRIRDILEMLSKDGIPLCKFTDSRCFYHSGILNYIKEQTKKLNINWKEYIRDKDNIEDLCKKYDYEFSETNFVATFGGYLE